MLTEPTAGAGPATGRPAVHELARLLPGRVPEAGSPAHDEERSGYQRYRPHRPDVVVAARTAADVATAVAFAADRGLPVAVQATGHGLSRAARGGLLISTRAMDAVHVDPAARTARVAAGVRWGRVVEEAARFGLAPLSGSAPHVGAVGYTLGGGIGLLARRHGYAADHVRSLDVVTADGTLRHAGPDREPDLFWGLRGGRDNLGVVTAMVVDLVEVTTLFGGGLYHDARYAPQVLRAYLEWTSGLGDATTSSVALVPFPDTPAVPAPLRGRHAVHVRVAHLGPDGERLVAPLRAAAPLLADTLGLLPFTRSGTIHHDPPSPMPYTATNVLLSDVDDAVLDVVVDGALGAASAGAQRPPVVELRHLGGALARPPAVPGAVGHRDAGFLLGLVTRLGGPAAERAAGADAADAVEGAARAAHDRLLDRVAALPGRVVGRSLNFLYGPHVDADTVRRAYHPADHARLILLKARHDPQNLFRLNHNLPPEPRRETLV